MPPMLSDDEGSSSDAGQISPLINNFRRKVAAVPENTKSMSIDDDDEEDGDIKHKKKDEEEGQDEDGEDEIDDEDDDEEGVYVVETITNHLIGEDGTPRFLVKWEGYDKKTDMTWEPEANLLESASLILENYYKSVGGREFVVSGGKPLKKKKRGRQPNLVTPDVKSNGKKTKRDHPGSSTPPASVRAEWKPPTGSWEEDIASIDAIEEVNNKLSVYVQWTDGRQSQHEIKAMYSHCPQKMLKFYESHLVFKKGGGTAQELRGVGLRGEDGDD